MSPPRVQAWPTPALPGQLQIGVLVMGAGTPYGLQSLEGFDMPAIAAAEAPRAGGEGSFGGIDLATKRPLILHLAIHPPTIVNVPVQAVLARSLKAAFAPAQDLVGLGYNHPDLGQLLFLGRPRRVAFTTDHLAPWPAQEDVLVQFDALDPAIYSGTLNDLTVGYGTAGTNAGFTFNRATPAATPGLAFNRATPASTPGAASDAAAGGAGAAGFVQATSNGNRNSAPVTRIIGGTSGVTGPIHLQRVESNEDVVLNFSMNPGDVLELDHDLHTVILNGSSNRADIVDFSTAWWQIQPGLQTIHYRTEGPGLGSSAEILWRDAWW